MGNVARPKATQGESETTRGERLVLRSRQAANQPYSRAIVQKTRHPVPRFSYPGVPAPAGMCDWRENNAQRLREWL